MPAVTAPRLIAPLLAVATVTQAAHAAETIVISGSSTVYPFSQAAIRSFTPQAPKGVSFKAEAIGSTSGLRAFCEGKLSLATASRPINRAELERCSRKGVPFLELPIGFDAITVVVNQRNGFAREISTTQLRTLWNQTAQGQVMRWNQVNSAWPATAIKLCGPGRNSGTYDTFNKAINGSESNSRQDYISSEDDDVLVSCVARDPNALGYFGFDYYQANRSQLKALAVKGLRGSVLPSQANVQSSSYLPLSRPLFFYVNDQAMKTKPALRAFVTATLQRGVSIAKQAGVIPLQDSTYRLVTNKLYRNVLGSAFSGDLPIGLTIGQVLQKSFDEHKKPQFR